ncbi:MAG: hypothetical protein H7Y27_07305 [Gemmatimonadaceae bacterium]|nr:hypothetical protein [Chitinophagaceae bacterium]
MIETVTIALLIILGITAWKLFSQRTNGRNKYMRSPTNQLLRYGMEAEAIILNVQPTGLQINNLPQVRVQIKVEPERGRNFVAEVNEVLSENTVPFISAGRRVKVKYNPQNNRVVRLLL